MNQRYKLIRNSLGQYGVLDTYTGNPTELECRRDGGGPLWISSRDVAEQAMVKFEGWEQRRQAENTWEVVK
jgi:hypothetical protein